MRSLAKWWWPTAPGDPLVAMDRRSLLNAGAAAVLMPQPLRNPTAGAEVRASSSVAAGPTAAESESGMTARVADVRRFGAKADGVSDDTPAFNAALQHIRDHQTKLNGIDICFKLLIPSGVYCLNGSINMTGIHGINMVVEGDASVLLGRCAGMPVIDALGSRWLVVRDLTVIGDKSATPQVGIQIGRAANGIVADDHRFENVKLIGHYTLACLVNFAAETSEFDHLLLWNDHPDPGSYCLVQDGLNHFATGSAFVTQAAKRELDESFNENEFTNCDFRHGGGGIPVWLGDTARHLFIRCYAACGGKAAFMVYCGGNSHVMLDVDCHCETGDMQSVFLFTGTQTHTTIHGFNYVDHQSWAARSIFACDPRMERIVLQDARIDIGGFANRSCKVFDEPQKWQVTGYYSSRGNDDWNGGGVFNGLLLRGGDVELAGQVGIKVQSGYMTDRPGGLGNGDAGRLFMDVSSNRLIAWSGTMWVDAFGNRA
jgi:hypothetical protein